MKQQITIFSAASMFTAVPSFLVRDLTHTFSLVISPTSELSFFCIMIQALLLKINVKYIHIFIRLKIISSKILTKSYASLTIPLRLHV